MPPFFSSLNSILLSVGHAVFKWPKTQATNNEIAPRRESELELKGNVQDFHPIVAELKRAIEGDADLYMGFHQIFEQIPNDPKYGFDPTGKPQVRNYHEMLHQFQILLTCAPEFGDEETSELVPVPLNAMLNWPMNTLAALRIFTNPTVNSLLRNILSEWARFLSTPDSRYTLTDCSPNGWFSPSARLSIPNFEETFECAPSKEHWGFQSWDDFFTRKFRPGIRPVHFLEDDSVITSACESVTYKISYNVQSTSSFWLKGESYSLTHMLKNDPLTPHFIGGTVYQAYLSALNYHRWHSPVNGRIVKISHVPGTYCAISPATGFDSGNPDPATPDRSQAFLANMATRMLIFIQADDPDIGLMCFIAVGMVEVSSCEASVVVGQRVKKGEELGMFHYGGSTYCLVLRPQTKVAFSDGVAQSMEDRKTRVLLNAPLAYVAVKSG
ncbi:Phosphatidylserine decarboxylase proenzyme 3 [Leucoagaricus sp. SymC.cos]|nr:Phosphatidylserine decarboxylase proenzyme 3 [Leucoagaricus sp. SymC.cos]